MDEYIPPPCMKRRLLYLEDCEVLQARILDEAQYDLDLHEVQEFWEWRSDLVAAQWLVTDYTIEGETLRDLMDEWIAEERRRGS